MTWRSLGDSNPVFAVRGRLNRFAARIQSRWGSEGTCRPQRKRRQQFIIFDAGSDRDIETAFATFVQRGLVRCSPVPAHS